MGTIVVTEFISLDGIVEDPGGAEAGAPAGWTAFDRGAEGDQLKLAELNAADAQLLGRVTYDGFAAAWPAIEDEAADVLRALLRSSECRPPPPPGRKLSTSPSRRCTPAQHPRPYPDQPADHPPGDHGSACSARPSKSPNVTTRPHLSAGMRAGCEQQSTTLGHQRRHGWLYDVSGPQAFVRHAHWRE